MFMLKIHQIINRIAQQNDKKTAIIADEQEITYGELVRKIYTLSDMLIVEGLRRGDRVIILLKDPINCLSSFYAVIRAGGIAVPLKQSSKLSNLTSVIAKINPSLIITSRDDIRFHSVLLDSVLCPIFYLENKALLQLEQDSRLAINDYDETDQKVIKLLNLKEEDGAFILIDSETDDNFNALIYSQQMLLKKTESLNRLTFLNAGICELSLHPLSDIIGLITLTKVLFAGGTVILKNDDLKPLTIVQTLMRHHCNVVSIKSEILFSLISNAGFLLKELDCQLDFVEVYGDAMKLIEKKILLDIFSRPKLHLFHGTNAAPVSTVLELRSERRKINTAGKPLQGIEIDIKVNNSQNINRNQAGEIMIYDGNTSTRYWYRGNKQAESIAENGWVNTGDIGYRDPKGYLHILGRKGDLIDIGGVMISPYEIEEKIHDVYQGYEICVVGIPDPLGINGDIPVLCYIAVDGKTIIPSELPHVLSRFLSKNQIPKIVYRMDRFPHAGNIILRQELRRQIIEKFKHQEVA
jgi:long-chain acyl-CoA synthetase